MKKFLSIIIVFAVVCAFSAPEFAWPFTDADGTWKNGAGDWSQSVNWVDGILAYGEGKTADFNQVNLIGDTTVNMNIGSGVTIGKIIFGDTAISNHSWTLISYDAKIMTLDNTGGAGAPVITVNDLGTGTATISPVVAGTAGLIKSGAGTLILTGMNTYTGDTTVNAGTLMAGEETQAFGIGSAVTVGAAGTLDLNKYNETIGSLAGSGTIDNTGAADNVLTLGEDNTSTSFSGLIKNSGPSSTGITKEGTGMFTLSGPNTYTGTTTVNAGILKAGAITQVFGIGSAVTVGASGTLDLGGYNETIGSLAGSSGGIVTNTGIAAATLTVGDTTSITFSGVIQNGTGTMSLTKQGTGTLTLTSANTYTGATTVSVGTLALDYTTIGSKLSDTSTLVMAGGTLNLQNGATLHTEVIASTTLNAGASSVTRTSGTSVLQMNTITRNVGSSINFGAAGIATTDNANTNGILGGWATVGGTDWAMNSTGGADGAITAYAGYTNDFWLGAACNTTVTNNATVVGCTTNSLRFNAAGAYTLTLDAVNTISSGGILVTSNVGNKLNTITGGNLQGASGADLIVIQNNTSNGLTIGSVIQNNASATGLTKFGAGTLTLSGANIYTGATTISAGVLNIRHATATGTTAGGVSVTSGAALQIQGTSAVLLEALTLNGTGISNDGALRNISDANSWSGAVTLGSATRINSDSGTLTLSGNIGGAAQNLTVGGAGATILSGIIGTTTGTLTKDGTGTLTLSGLNTYTGTTTVDAGTLALQFNTLNNKTGVINSGSALTLGGASTLSLLGTVNAIEDDTQTFASTTLSGGQSTVLLTKNNANPLTATLGAITRNAKSYLNILTIPSAGASLIVNSSNAASNGLLGTWASVGSGTTLSYAATNGTTITEYTGAENATAANLDNVTSATTNYKYAAATDIGAGVLTGNTLEYTGGATVTNLGTGTLTLNGLMNSGSDELRISGGGANGLIIGANGELNIISNARGFTINSVISGTGAVVYGGPSAGTLMLSGANTYTGDTIINAGTLGIGNYSAIPRGSGKGNVYVNGAGSTLMLCGISQQINGLNGTGTVDTLTDEILTIGDNDADGSFSGVIQNSTGGKTLGITKIGTGTEILSGANTYTGTTTASAGTLLTTKAAALSGYGTGGKVVFGGGTVGVQVGGSGWTTGEVDTLLTNATKTSGALGVDTTNGNLTQWIAFTTTNFGSALGLTKLGTNTLTLDQANTYTGVTLISGGTLQIGSGGTTGSLNTASAITNNDKLAFNQTDTVTQGTDFNSVIAGTGALDQNGSGTLILDGLNTYAGLTSIAAGTLSFNTVAAGASAQSLGENAALSLSGGGTLVYTGAAGALDKNITIGAGNGIIQNTGAGLLTLSGSVVKSGTTLTLKGGASGITVSGVISGALANSDLIVNGGTVTLASTNTYTGPTFVYGFGTLKNGIANALPTDTVLTLGEAATNTIGTYDLAGFNQTIAGLTTAGVLASSVTNSAAGAGTNTLTVNNDTLTSDSDYTFNGVINDGATAKIALTKTGDKTLVISGPNTHSGATLISGGTLQIGSGGTTGSLGSGTVTDNAALKFNRSNASTVANVISGSGTLEQAGTGTLTLTGANSYSGATMIKANSTVVAGNNSALGNGSAVTNNGTLSIGLTDLRVGTYSQVNSKLTLTVNSASDYGTITSTGAGTINGGTIDITVNDYIANGATLDIITSDGGLAYTPETVVTPFNNLRCTFTASKVGTDTLRLTASRTENGYASDAANGNEANVGNVLDNVTNPTTDMTTVLNALNVLNPSQTADALNSTLPDYSGAALQVTQSTLDQLTEAVLGHQASLRNSLSGVSTGDDMLKGVDVWAQVFGSYLHQDPRQLSQGYNATIWGTALGFDIPAMNDIRVGTCFGFAQDYIRGKDNSNRNNINSYQWTIYGEYAKDAYYIDLSGAFALNTYDASRQVAVGAINRTASADYNGQQYQIYVEGGYTLNCRKDLKLKSDLNITPLASFQYEHLYLEKYTETGANAMNLTVKAQNYDLAQTGFGVKFDYPFNTKYGQFVPELRFKWLYDWIGDAQATTSNFSGGGGSFATNGFNPAQSSWDFGAKVTMFTKNNWELATNYDFELKEDFYGHYGYVNAKHSF